jgi:hypothetical protein
MSQLGLLEVRSSNQKSLLILGLIANYLAQRIDGCGQAGGESVRLTIGYCHSPPFAEDMNYPLTKGLYFRSRSLLSVSVRPKPC